jgi:replicative DNA helicase
MLHESCRSKEIHASLFARLSSPNLKEIFFANDHTSKIAITGLGGVGKTQLVLELLYRTKEKHKDCSIIWIPATSIESLHQGYLAVAQQLDIPGCKDEKADVKKLVQNHLSKEDAGQWLLVFDNADDINMWMAAAPTQEREDMEVSVRKSSGGSRRLIDYLPKIKRGCIIFTTRDRRAAVKLAQQNIITVPEMSEKAAIELLQKCLASPNLVDYPQDATALLESLTYLPLAIAQGAAYINENGITLSDYYYSLKRKKKRP